MYLEEARQNDVTKIDKEGKGERSMPPKSASFTYVFREITELLATLVHELLDGDDLLPVDILPL